MNMEHVNGEQTPKRGRGRPKKDDIQKYRYMIRFNDADNTKFLAMYKASGMRSISSFITHCVLNHKLKIITIDKSAIDFVMLLTQFFGQFRAIKTNYNQLFATLVRNLGEDKTRFMMKILEHSTLEFAQSKMEIEAITNKLREKCLPK